MSHDFQDELTSRLIRYCKIDSQSDADSQSSPSTDIQLDMQHLLMSELKEIGATDRSAKFVCALGVVWAGMRLRTRSAPSRTAGPPGAL